MILNTKNLKIIKESNMERVKHLINHYLSINSRKLILIYNNFKGIYLQIELNTLMVLKITNFILTWIYYNTKNFLNHYLK